MNRRGFLGAIAAAPIITKTLARFRFHSPEYSDGTMAFRFIVMASTGEGYDSMQSLAISEGQSIVVAPENGELVISICEPDNGR